MADQQNGSTGTAPAAPSPVAGSDSGPEAVKTDGNTPTVTSDFTPITSQEDLNRIIAARVSRAKPSDYDDLKAKAAKLDEIEQQNMSELDKAAAKIKAAEARAELAERTALRSKVQARFKIEDTDAELFLTGDTEEKLIAQAERLTARNVAQDPPDPSATKRLQIPNSAGSDQNNPAADREAIARSFFGLS